MEDIYNSVFKLEVKSLSGPIAMPDRTEAISPAVPVRSLNVGADPTHRTGERERAGFHKKRNNTNKTKIKKQQGEREGGGRDLEGILTFLSNPYRN